MILKINLAIYVLSSQDGNDNCSRKACPSLSCRYQIQDENACCSRCAVNRAEVGRETHIIMVSFDNNKKKLAYRCPSNQFLSLLYFRRNKLKNRFD